MKNHFHSPIPALAALTIVIASMVAACSTTRRLPRRDPVYRSEKDSHDYPDSDTVGLSPGLAGDVKDAVNVAAQQFAHLPVYPLPVFRSGLWVYNNWDDPGHGFKQRLYEKLVAEPVLYIRCTPRGAHRDDRPDTRNNGYFSGHASYSLVRGKNKEGIHTL